MSQLLRSPQSDHPYPVIAILHQHRLYNSCVSNVLCLWCNLVYIEKVKGTAEQRYQERVSYIKERADEFASDVHYLDGVVCGVLVPTCDIISTVADSNRSRPVWVRLPWVCNSIEGQQLSQSFRLHGEVQIIPGATQNVVLSCPGSEIADDRDI